MITLDLRAIENLRFQIYIVRFLFVFSTFIFAVFIPFCINLAKLIDIGENEIDNCIAYQALKEGTDILYCQECDSVGRYYLSATD